MDLFSYNKEVPEINLRPYQEKAIANALSNFRNGDNKQLLILATSMGKTICFAALAKHFIDASKKVLVVAHRAELLEQAADKMSWINKHATMSLEQGESWADADADIIFASVATIGRSGSSRIERFKRDHFGLVIFDECFSHSTMVHLADGSIMPIRKICNKINRGEDVFVKSWDYKENKWVSKKAVRSFIKNNSKDGWVEVKLGMKLAKTRCTSNHGWYLDGYKKVTANNLKAGDLVITHPDYNRRDSIPQALGSNQRQLLLGGLIGDLGITLTKNAGRAKIIHGLKQEDYFNYKVSILKNLISENPKKYKTEFSPDTGIIQVSTLSSVEIYNIKKRWVDEDYSLLDEVDDRGWAFAFMDDGTPQTGMAKLFLNAMTKKQADAVCNAFNKRYSASAKISNEKGYVMVVNTSDYRNFCNAAGTYFHPSLHYKVERHFNGSFTQLTSDPKNYALLSVASVSKSTPPTEDKKTYNIEVEDHHNYCVGVGALVANCHHATASTYKNVIDYFSHPDCLIFGVTATPNRGDDEDLSNVFNSVCYKMDIVDGTKQGYLTPVISHRVSSKTDLSRVRTTAGDFNIKDLSAAVNNANRNSLIVETYLKRFPDKKAIVFATDLDHASALEAEFNRCGIKAVSITGETDKTLRKRYIDDFKSGNGSIKVVLNFSVLTEGFDYPELELIIQARPTQSQLLLTQIAGRISRLSNTKSVAHIVEIIDHHSNKTATTAKIFSFRQNFDCEEHSFLECIKKAEEFEREKEYFNPYNCESWSDMILRFERSDRTNPSGNPIMSIGGGGVRIGKEEVYSQFQASDLYFESRYRYMKSKADTLKLIHSDKDRQLKYRIQIYANGLGGYDVTMHKKPTTSGFYDKPEQEISYRCASQAEAAKKIEAYILENYQEWDILLNVNSAWRKKASIEPATDKQWALIQRYGLTRKPKSEVTKSEAMELLSLHFNK